MNWCIIMSQDSESMQRYYVESSRPRHKIYALLLIIGMIIVVAFAFSATESSIDTIAKKYPERTEIQSDTEAEDVAYAVQSLFSETGFLLSDVSSALP